MDLSLILLLEEISPVPSIPKSTPYKALLASIKEAVSIVLLSLNLCLHSKNDVLTVSKKNYCLCKRKTSWNSETS